MRAGLLEDYITIKRATFTQNAFGEREETWGTHYTTKARVINRNGTRAIENGEILHDYSKTIEVWHYVDIKETDIIVLDDKKYRITNIDKDKHQLKKIVNLKLINE